MSKNKKKTTITIVGILVLVIAVVGTSYAIWNYVYNGTLKNTLETADISLEFLESNTNIITVENALPMGCTEGKQQEETFDFAVTSTTTRDTKINYTLTIEKLSVDTGYTALNDNQVALYLTNYDGTNELLPSNYNCPVLNAIPQESSNTVDKYKNIKPMLLSNTDTGHISLISQLNNYQLYSGTHMHDSTHNKVQDKFKLRAWIAPDVDASSWNSSTKLQYKFKIGVTSEEDTSRYVYRYGTNVISIGTTLNPVSGTKWIIMVNGEENEGSAAYAYDTHDECTAFLTSMGITEGEEIEADGTNITLTCVEKTGTFGGIGDYTEDYTTLNKTIFLGHKIGNDGKVERNDVCFIRNNTLYCLKGVETANADYSASNLAPYYIENHNTLLEAFGPKAIENSICSGALYDNRVNGTYCSISDFKVDAYKDGHIRANDDNVECDTFTDGNSACYE